MCGLRAARGAMLSMHSVDQVNGNARSAESVDAAPRMMTDVVPSPTSSSCVRDKSITDCTETNHRGMMDCFSSYVCFSQIHSLLI